MTIIRVLIPPAHYYSDEYYCNYGLHFAWGIASAHCFAIHLPFRTWKLRKLLSYNSAYL